MSVLPRYVRAVDEGERVLRRLRKIDALERANTRPEDLLAELRELVVEAEAWARTEAAGSERAAAALAACRDALSRGRVPLAAG